MSIKHCFYDAMKPFILKLVYLNKEFSHNMLRTNGMDSSPLPNMTTKELAHAILVQAFEGLVYILLTGIFKDFHKSCTFKHQACGWFDSSYQYFGGVWLYT